MGDVGQQPVEHLRPALRVPHLLGAHLLQPACHDDRFAAPVDVQLAVDGGHVQLDRALGDAQARRDLPVRQPVGCERQDFDLLGRELPAAADAFGFHVVRGGHRLGVALLVGERALAWEMRPMADAFQDQTQHDCVWLSVYRRGT